MQNGEEGVETVCLECGHKLDIIGEGLCKLCYDFLHENKNVVDKTDDELIEDFISDAELDSEQIPADVDPVKWAAFKKYQKSKYVKAVSIIQTVDHRFHCELCNTNWTEVVLVKHTSRYRKVKDRYTLDLITETCSNCTNTLLSMPHLDLVKHVISHIKTLNQNWKIRRR